MLKNIKKFTMGGDAVALADLVWAMGATGKFVWPIPDKGLARRLHRVTAPTLLVWGDRDYTVSLSSAARLAKPSAVGAEMLTIKGGVNCR